MVIISASMNESMLKELDRLQKKLGFSGRSDIIRGAIRCFISENKEMESPEGTLDSVLIGVHEQSAEQAIAEIKHRHEVVIKTQMHTHLSSKKCLEIFVLYGNSGEIKEFYRECQRCGEMTYLRMLYA